MIPHSAPVRKPSAPIFRAVRATVAPSPATFGRNRALNGPRIARRGRAVRRSARFYGRSRARGALEAQQSFVY